MSNNIIYGLMDPLTKQLKYVGKTERGYKRIQEHFSTWDLKSKSYKNNWIKSLLKKGLMPEVIIIDSTEFAEQLNDLEIFYIDLFKRAGLKLTNLTIGGEGVKGNKHTLETKEKLRKAATGKISPRRIKILCEQTNEIFDSLMDAAKKLNISFKRISKQMSGNCKQVKGLTFRKLDDEEIKNNVIKTDKKPFVLPNKKRLMTLERALEEAKKFNKRSEFHDRKRNEYEFLKKQGMLDELFKKRI